jgi:deoxyribodipyrimidine photolyase-related protein
LKEQQAIILFPHQLLRNTALLNMDCDIYLVEEFLFFKHYKFHKQKIAFHRATMKAYEVYLNSKNKTVHYIEATSKLCDIRQLIPKLIGDGIMVLHIIDPTDNWLQKHINSVSKDIKIQWYNNPLFINSKEELSSFFKPSKKKFFQTSFYKAQRKQRNILMVSGEPEGGKWTYDTDNRKKYPKDKTPPHIQFPDKTDHHKEAEDYVSSNFDNHYGDLSDFALYPIDYNAAEIRCHRKRRTFFKS